MTVAGRVASYVRQWLILAAVVGVLSGLGAAGFLALFRLATDNLLERIGGYHPATLAGEGGFVPATQMDRPYLVVIVAVLGALVAAVLVALVAPETSGHGTDAAIKAANHDPQGIRSRVAAVKMVASALTIGSGSSGGTEGPIAQISAALGSMVSRVLGLSPEQARLTVTMGMGSGIGAIFRAPLGGAILGAEMLFRKDIATEVIVPSLVSAATAFGVFGLFFGFDPIFGEIASVPWSVTGQIVAVPLLGLLAGLIGRLYIKSFYLSIAWFGRWPVPKWLRPASAAVVVASLGLLVPGVLGTGYGAIQAAMEPGNVLRMSLWLVIALPFAKIVATSLSIGSGGSGGVFGPGLVIGGCLGAGVWRILEPTGLMPASPAPLVIIGMAACLGPIIHAPLGVIVMVAEATSNTRLILPSMVATGLACLVVGDQTLYRSQLETRAELSTALRPSSGNGSDPNADNDADTHHDDDDETGTDLRDNDPRGRSSTEEPPYREEVSLDPAPAIARAHRWVGMPVCTWPI
jgi:CIC family chloride channel protein